MRTIHSNVWFQCLGGGMWLAGAALSVCWMLRAGGLIWPAVAFSLWVTVLAAAFLIAETETGKSIQPGAMAYRAVKHGLASGLVVLLGSLFVEFWPVTVSMACVFALCSRFKRDDGVAYN